MKFRRDPVHVFTSHVDGLVRELRNDVYISEAYQFVEGTGAPKTAKFVCVWDTGATNTVITSRVVEAVGLQPSGKATAVTVGPGAGAGFNEYEVDTYLINIYLPNKVTIIGLPASEGAIGGADVLIGMDIIALGDFAITNCDGRSCWTFRMPSIENIDFVKEVEDHNEKYKHLLASPDDKRKLRNQAKRDRKRFR